MLGRIKVNLNVNKYKFIVFHKQEDLDERRRN